jgi:organic hydroperoxide reductase OsmC/OhrA
MSLTWTGNNGTGTSAYTAYRRDHEVTSDRKPAPLLLSSDPAFRGDPSRFSPEELLVASLSSCHMLWALHLCAAAGIVVTAYSDSPEGTMIENSDGSGEFTSVTLRPHVVLADPARAAELKDIHHRAHEVCFISRSVNFPVQVEPA